VTGRDEIRIWKAREMNQKLRKDIHPAKRGKESLRGNSVEAAFDKSEGNGGICDEEKGRGWVGENLTHHEGAKWG
jgi:hypothetical protein